VLCALRLDNQPGSSRAARRLLEGILVAVLCELGAVWPEVPLCGTLVVRSLVPVLGKGKGGRAPSNRLYSYSIYVLESSHLGIVSRCSWPIKLVKIGNLPHVPVLLTNVGSLLSGWCGSVEARISQPARLI
jgi:hypothetical protein